MAVKTWYNLNALAVSPYWWGPVQEGGTAPASANCAYGFKTTTQTPPAYYYAMPGASSTTGTHSATSIIDAQSGPTPGAGTGTLVGTGPGDSFRVGPYSGTFAAGYWNFNLAFTASVATQFGRIRIIVFKSSNPDGSSATKLTSSTQVGTTVSLTNVAIVANSGVSWNAPEITLDGEYLFFTMEWEVTAGGSAINSATVFRQGGESTIASTDFTAKSTSGVLYAKECTTPLTADSTLYSADSTILTADQTWVDLPGDTAAFTGIVSDRVGVLAATEGADTASFAGMTTITGTLAAVEGTGIPWWQQERGNFTGTVEWHGVLAAVEGADSASFTGNVAAAGTGEMVAVEAPDIAAFTGTVTWLGVLAATEARDTASFTGEVAWHGVLEAVEAPDTALFLGDLIDALGATEAPDTAHFTGLVASYPGFLAATEGNDQAAFTGYLEARGTLNAVEGRDTAQFIGPAGIVGVLDATEGADTARFAEGNIEGVLDAHEDGSDTWVPTADDTTITADSTYFTADSTYFGDYAEFTGEVRDFVGVLDVTEDADSAAFTGEVHVSGVLAAVEDSDIAAFIEVLPAITGVLAAVEEGKDRASFWEAAWDFIEGEALKNEVLHTEWLKNPEPRTVWLANEVEDTRWLMNLAGRTSILRNEVQRITEQ